MGVRFTKDTYTKSVFKNVPEEAMPNEIIIIDSKGKKFPVYDNKNTDTSIDNLCLSKRSSNGIKRKKIFTIKELINNFPNAQDLMNVDGLGKTSVNEIYGKLFNWQSSVLSDSFRVIWNKRSMELNV